MKVPYLEELVLNVVTPTEEEMEERRYVDAYKRKSVGVLGAENLVEMLEGFIECLRSPASIAGHYASQYGLFEKLGMIRFVWMRGKLGHGALIDTLVAEKYYTWPQPSDKEILGVTHLSKIIVIYGRLFT